MCAESPADLYAKEGNPNRAPPLDAVQTRAFADVLKTFRGFAAPLRDPLEADDAPRAPLENARMQEVVEMWANVSHAPPRTRTPRGLPEEERQDECAEVPQKKVAPVDTLDFAEPSARSDSAQVSGASRREERSTGGGANAGDEEAERKRLVLRRRFLAYTQDR